LSQFLKWTRRPCDWEVRSVSDYDFDELQSFFIKEVRLYVPTEDAIKGLRILDIPGFGVSSLHNSICREAQRESKAIILVLDSQLVWENLDQIKQLKTEIGSNLADNIFVIWNHKSVTKANGEWCLDLMLRHLKLEANIIIPRNRVAIVNLRLALREMQSKKMQSKKIVKGTDFLFFSNDYPDTFAESLDSSGWNDVIRLFKVIQGRIFAI
jgi:hypothetical protein